VPGLLNSLYLFFDPQLPAASLSGGERVKALLCGAFLSGADYLLLDEPTNHLDRAGREWFWQQLSRCGAER
jgi:ATPase components of ABC transporters with duplicated ATPase domains